MSRLLSDQERDRFASWLEQEAKSDEGTARQLEGLARGPSDPTHVLALKFRIEAGAAKVIAKKLRETQSMTLGGDPTVTSTNATPERREQT